MVSNNRNGGAYSIGRMFGQMPRFLRWLLGLGAAIFIYQCATHQAPRAGGAAVQPLTPEQLREKIAAAAAARKKACEENGPAQLAEYDALNAKREHWAAAGVIRSCAEILKTPNLLALVKDAEIKSHMADINNPKTPVRSRANSMMLLARDHPDVGAKYAQQAIDLIAKADREDAAAAAAKKRKEGVSVGMSKEDVLGSSWGKPDKINSSHYAHGTHEQWVYRSRGQGYLYFENGVLTSIQN